MMNFRMKLRALFLIGFTLLFLLGRDIPAHAQYPVDTFVISQIYTGGGLNSGSPTYKNDYVELFNGTSASINLSTYSLQYNSPTGTSAFTKINLTGNVKANGYFLIRTGDTGTAGGDLPTGTMADLILGTTISLATASGKVALVSNQMALAAGTTPVIGGDVSAANATGTANIVDFIGYGTANAFEGTGAGPTGTSTTSIKRNGVDFNPTDTNQNSLDFSNSSPIVLRDSNFAPTPAPPGLASLLIGLCVSGWKARRQRKRQKK